MYPIKKSAFKYFVMFSFTAFMSCERYLNIDPPIDKLDSHSVFADSTSASSAITGIYADMVFGNNGFTASQVRWAGLYSNELVYSGSSDAILQFMNNSLQADNSNIGNLWSNLYSHIYQANSVIERTQASTGINHVAKDILTGEARFIRAFLFFYAVNNWGDVPLTLSTDYSINESMPRSLSEKVYEQIVEDLTFAANVLPVVYSNSERTRPNKWTAIALLARVRLYLQNWDEADQLASQVINSGTYTLATLQNVFLKESNEVIWQLYPAGYPDIFNTYDGYYFIPSSLTNSSIPAYLVTEDLYSSFETGDQRKVQWIGIKETGPYFFPYKYKIRQSTVKSEYNIVFRLAELYLIKAEAEANLNKLRDAIQDVNVIRGRAALNDLSPLPTKEETLHAVGKERQHELFCEWGHRWYDLKRTGHVDNHWPIPTSQLLTNPKLHQNEGF